MGAYTEIYIFLALIGLIAGLLSGLLGIGGGIITVPALLFSLHFVGFSSPYLMHVALGTSLGAMIFTSASSAWAHIKKKGVNWHYFFSLLPGTIVGVILGAFLADYLPGKKLQHFSGFVECLFGLYFIFRKEGKEIESDHKKPRSNSLSFPIGVVIGGLSSILGIGGGIMTVPLLIGLGMHFRNAVSTSAVQGFIIALIGAVSFLSLGIGKETIPNTIGYLYLPGFFIIGFSSILSTFLGAHLTYTLPIASLNKIFGLALFLIGIAMILK